ncbi:MAG: hypothetical protein DWH91_02120 [Planctomycetota bacterium]|nr:MAG: hypothetical protein DWH91_02120 [Planctomycetota bacterium]
MNLLVAHLISGRILFTGLGVMVGLILVGAWTTRDVGRRMATLGAWIAGLLSLTTAAVSPWLMGGLGLMLTLWTALGIVTPARESTGRRKLAATALPVGFALLLIAREFPWLQPVVSSVPERSIVVLGDSLSAGLGEGEGMPWPFQLRDLHQLQVTNLSDAGATTHDALQRIRATDHFPGLVIIELGGNDLLGGRSRAEFEQDLDQILADLNARKRSVVMLELPLLPGKSAWGVTQRSLATKYNCGLIPKRYWADVLAAPGATVDTLHLSQAGHRQMAEMIWGVIEESLPAP